MSKLLERLRERNGPRPNFDHLNDPGLWARIGMTEAVEGDDGEVAEVVKPKAKRRRRQSIVLDAVEPNQPITLPTAVRIAFPDGSMTVSGLRNEIAKRNLRASKMSGQIYVTMNDIERMVELCTIGAGDKAKERDFTSGKPSDPVSDGAGSSSTSHQPEGGSSAALAHLQVIAQGLKKPSRNTSRRNTNRVSAKVIPLKS